MLKMLLDPFRSHSLQPSQFPTLGPFYEDRVCSSKSQPLEAASRSMDQPPLSNLPGTELRHVGEPVVVPPHDATAPCSSRGYRWKRGASNKTQTQGCDSSMLTSFIVKLPSLGHETRDYSIVLATSERNSNCGMECHRQGPHSL